MKQKIVVTPLKGVNDISFGTKIELYLKKYSFRIIRSDETEIPNWDTYFIDEFDMEVYVEDGIIVSIACRKTLTYEDYELLGLNIQEFQNIFKVEYTETDKIFLSEEIEPHNVYEFDSLGLQVWEKDQKIDCIFCSDGQ